MCELNNDLTRVGHTRAQFRLSENEADGLRCAIDEVTGSLREGQQQSMIAERFGDPSTTRGWKINNAWTVHSEFARMATSQKLVCEIAQLTGARTLQLWRDQVLFKPAGSGGIVKWHQDAYWWSILSPHSQVTAWVALDDVDRENGCLRMVDRSHEWGVRTRAVRILNELSALPLSIEGLDLCVSDYVMAAGEVSYHHCLTWHASYPNTSSRPRRAYAIHYLVDETRVARDGEHPIKDLITTDATGCIAGPLFPTLWRNGEYVKPAVINKPQCHESPELSVGSAHDG